MDQSLASLKRHALFAPLIKKHGAPKLDRYHGQMKVFSAILRSMVYQQISTAAATSIHTRFLALFPKKGPTPDLLLQTSETDLRTAGLSTSKIKYMRDAAQRFKDGTIREKDFVKLSSHEIIENLTQINGVGVWTAHMLLIFTLKRPDILPTGDLGIRKGFQVLYRLRALPDHKKMEQLAKDWREHASVASWYLWRLADGAKLSKSPQKKSPPRAKSTARQRRQ